MERPSIYAIPRIDSSEKVPITKADIIKEVCRQYKLDKAELYQKTKKVPICEPRMVVMALLRNLLGWTLSKAGLEFGKSTANTFNAVKRTRNLYTTEKAFKNNINSILTNLIDEKGMQEVIERLLDEDRKDERLYRQIYEKYQEMEHRCECTGN